METTSRLHAERFRDAETIVVSSRRRLLARLAAIGILLPAFAAGAGARAHVRDPIGTAVTRTEGLVDRGISYDTGTDYVPEFGVLSRRVWNPEHVTHDLTAIRDGLHCNAVALSGTEIARNTEAARIAAGLGLRISIQPRLFEAEEDDLLAHLAESAREAERLRAGGAEVTLNIGVEWSLFAVGIVPGADFIERTETLLATLDQLPIYSRRLNELLGKAAAVAHAEFHGPLTYGAGMWEGVDWEPFDLVGVDFYRDAGNRATYVQDLRALHRFGKPVVITEFGCCTYEGAPDAGAAGYDIVDWGAVPPELNGDYVRSEQTQADEIGDLIALYEAEGMAGAFVYTFVEPEMTYDPDPRFDLGMASFGVVKIFPAASGRGYEETGYWAPKAAFYEIARRYRA